jgi:hypothetical protein
VDIVLVQWEGPFEGWAHKFVAKNFWRIEPLMAYEDALQECALLFFHIRNHYRDKVDNPAWLMSLYKTSVNNYFKGTSLKATAKRLHEIAVEDLAALGDAIQYDVQQLTAKEARMSAGVYQELETALEMPGATAEKLLEKLGELDDDAFKKLSKQAQKWYQAAAEAYNADKPLPEIPGLNADGGKAAKKQTAAKPKAEKAEKKPKRVDPRERILELIVANPTVTVEQLQELAVKEELKLIPSTIAWYWKIYTRIKAAEARLAGGASV